MLYGQALTFPAGPTVGPNQVFVSTSWLYANKMDYRGAWNAGVVYNSEDAVVSAGSTYVSLQALNLGENPATSPSYWAAIGGGGGGGGGANSLGYYFMAQATNAPANGLNLGALSTGLLKITVSGGTAAPSMAVPGVDYEPGAGNPSTNGYCWTSTTAGVRSWAACGSGSMVYPGAGLPISTGSAWGTSIPRLDALVSIFDPAFGGCGACNAATNAAALTAAMTASRRVYIPAGNINMGPVTIPTNTILYGDGQFPTLLYMQAPGTLLTVGGPNVVLQDFGVVGIAGGSTGIDVSAGAVELDRIHVQNTTVAAVTISSGGWAWVKFSGVTIEHNVGVGISSLSGALAVLLTDNSIIYDNTGSGVVLSGTNNTFACNNSTIEDDGATDVVLGAVTAADFHDCYFETDMSGGQSTAHAIDVSGAIGVHISGGYYKNYPAAIYASTAVTGLAIDGQAVFNTFGLSGATTVSLAGSGSIGVSVGPITDQQNVGMTLGSVVNNYLGPFCAGFAPTNTQTLSWSTSGSCWAAASGGGGGSTRTWPVTFAGLVQAGVAGFSASLPATNAPTPTNAGGMDPLSVLDFPQGSSANYAYWWPFNPLPTGYVSNSNVTYTLISRCNPAACDSTHATSVMLYWACDSTGAMDAPSWTATTAFNITNVGGGRVSTTGTITPTCATGNALGVKILPTTTGLTTGDSFQLISAAFSVQGGM